jgi:hypothetical protein
VGGGGALGAVGGGALPGGVAGVGRAQLGVGGVWWWWGAGGGGLYSRSGVVGVYKRDGGLGGGQRAGRGACLCTLSGQD